MTGRDYALWPPMGWGIVGVGVEARAWVLWSVLECPHHRYTTAPAKRFSMQYICFV